jgi:hypothetical protein
MKKYYLLSLLLVMLLFQNCKKKFFQREKFTVTGRIYKNCNEVAANTTFYFVFDSNYPFKTDAPILFTTDGNGFFSQEFEKRKNDMVSISSSVQRNKNFYRFKLNNEPFDIGIIKQSVSSQLVIKLKTNHFISNLDTIKYVFQYGNFKTPIYGPITKDTIIATHTMWFDLEKYNNDPSDGEDEILWWNFGMTNSTNQTQVNYTIHGCASVADTAYIIVP